jgi:hypothetical protein
MSSLNSWIFDWEERVSPLAFIPQGSTHEQARAQGWKAVQPTNELAENPGNRCGGESGAWRASGLPGSEWIKNTGFDALAPGDQRFSLQRGWFDKGKADPSLAR